VREKEKKIGREREKKKRYKERKKLASAE